MDRCFYYDKLFLKDFIEYLFFQKHNYNLFVRSGNIKSLQTHTLMNPDIILSACC